MCEVEIPQGLPVLVIVASSTGIIAKSSSNNSLCVCPCCLKDFMDKAFNSINVDEECKQKMEDLKITCFVDQA